MGQAKLRGSFEERKALAMSLQKIKDKSWKNQHLNRYINRVGSRYKSKTALASVNR